MGKGDIKTRRGKIAKGTFGVTRPRAKSKNNVVAAQSKPKAEEKALTKKAPAKKKASSKK